VTIHSGRTPEFLARSRLRRLLARAALSGYGAVVAVSPAVQDALTQSGVSASRIEVQPAFCASQVRPGPLPEGFAEARNRRSPLLAMAYLPSPVYGFELMVEALQRLSAACPRIGLAVFGPGASQGELAKHPGFDSVAPFVECFGQLEHSQVLAMIQGCDAFIRPTLADGDAISVREALMLGVRSVASDAAERPPGTWVFRTGDAADLASKLSEALVSPAPTAPPIDAGPFLLSLYERLDGRLGRSIGS